MRCAGMVLSLGVILALSVGCRFATSREITGPKKTYYARCNLKVLRGNLIDYFNWQSAPTFVPAGRKLEVAARGGRATLTDGESGSKYHLDAFAAEYMHKFLSPEPPILDGLSEEVRKNIGEAVARVGMTKEEVYLAMGPPYRVGAKAATRQMTREQIMGQNLWIYARRRFGKNIGVEFGSDGKVSRTEGIWR